MKTNANRHSFLYIGAAALLACAALEPAQAATPAFFGAQGGGAISVGGRGGKVIEVTNLNDSGTGSLRACVEASGPRICVFRVGGTIRLSSQLKISNPYITIAGQTAPGGGITISGLNVLSTDTLRPATHNIVVQYVRIGVGYSSSRTAQTGDAVSIYGDTNTAIFDHVSLRWGQDETFQMWNNGGSIHHVTLSNSLLADPTAAHSTFLISGGGNSSLSNQINNNDWHHNLIVTGSHRIPLDKGGSSAFINNIVYNYGFYCSQILGGGKHDYIGNVYKQGPYSRSQGATGKHEIQANSASGTDAPDGSPLIYVAGNIGWNNTSPTGSQTAMMARVTGENGSENGTVPSTWIASSRQLTQTHQINPEPANTLSSTLLPHVGASRRLGCDGSWVSMRDSLDEGWISNFQNGTGSSPSQNSTFPTVANGTACADSDKDGMPDVWETAKGLNPNAADGTGDRDSDGFTNLEEYLNGTDPNNANNSSSGGSTPPPPPASSDTTAPAITAGSPSGTLPAGTTSATMSVATNEAASCRYAPSAGMAYSSMPYAFSSTGGTGHSTTVSGCQNGGNYIYFVRCQDAAGNAAQSDYQVGFAVATPSTPPPTGGAALEAESAANTLAGGARTMPCSTCSGGSFVAYLGQGGTVRFNNVAAAAAGQYQLTIYYSNPAAATMQVSVNGGAAATVSLPASGSWTTIKTATVPVSLNGGNNTLTFGNSSWTSNLDRIALNTGSGTTTPPPPAAFNPVSLEGESATLIGQARAFACTGCSGGQSVGYVGNNAGSVRFSLSVPAAGAYKVTLYYTTGSTASMTGQLSANGGAATTLTLPGSGGWNVAKSITTTLQLNAGANTILYANSAWAPNVDRIVVAQ